MEALADISERFALWARNIGALHLPKSKLSLDSRLQDAPEIQEWVCELLDDLMEALDDCKPKFLPNQLTIISSIYLPWW